MRNNIVQSRLTFLTYLKIYSDILFTSLSVFQKKRRDKRSKKKKKRKKRKRVRERPNGTCFFHT